MEKKQQTIAIFPGSFDPITLGHLNIIKRGAALFDKLIVCVMVNSAKEGLFSCQERIELIKLVLKGTNLTNIEVDCSDILLAEYAKKKHVKTVVRGLRAISDYENEIQMAIINNKINPGLDTVFLPSQEKYTYISSSMVKEVASCKTALHEFIPGEVAGALMERMAGDRQRKKEPG